MPEPLCPACHHRDHDPGSCEWCPNCELHTDEALDWLMRHDPMLVSTIGHPPLDVERLARALGFWYGNADESFRLVPMSADGGIMPTGDLRPFAAAIAKAYREDTDGAR